MSRVLGALGVVTERLVALTWSVSVVVVAIPFAGALWVLALLEDRARRRAGIGAPAPCCGECLC